jgi:hypothetical protein
MWKFSWTRKKEEAEKKAKEAEQKATNLQNEVDELKKKMNENGFSPDGHSKVEFSQSDIGVNDHGGEGDIEIENSLINGEDSVNFVSSKATERAVKGIKQTGNLHVNVSISKGQNKSFIIGNGVVNKSHAFNVSDQTKPEVLKELANIITLKQSREEKENEEAD